MFSSRKKKTSIYPVGCGYKAWAGYKGLLGRRGSFPPEWPRRNAASAPFHCLRSALRLLLPRSEESVGGGSPLELAGGALPAGALVADVGALDEVGWGASPSATSPSPSSGALGMVAGVAELAGALDEVGWGSSGEAHAGVEAEVTRTSASNRRTMAPW